MKIATWNVNSVRARLANIVHWIEEFSPDVLLLQEIKTVTETFPNLEFEELGGTIHYPLPMKQHYSCGFQGYQNELSDRRQILVRRPPRMAPSTTN